MSDLYWLSDAQMERLRLASKPRELGRRLWHRPSVVRLALRGTRAGTFRSEFGVERSHPWCFFLVETPALTRGALTCAIASSPRVRPRIYQLVTVGQPKKYFENRYLWRFPAASKPAHQGSAVCSAERFAGKLAAVPPRWVGCKLFSHSLIVQVQQSFGPRRFVALCRRLPGSVLEGRDLRPLAVFALPGMMYSCAMLRAAARTLSALLAALLFAGLSVVSAHRMAPDREVVERQAALQAMGASLEEFCGLAEDGHEHRCPYCHTLPEAPRIAAPDNGARITRVIEHRVGRDLVVGPQDVRIHASPRAPPHAV